MAFAPFRSLAVALAGFGAVIGTALPMASSAQAAGVLDSMMSILGFQHPGRASRSNIGIGLRWWCRRKSSFRLRRFLQRIRAANWPKDPDVEYRKSVNNDTKLRVNMRPDRVAPNGRVPVANAPRKPTANSGAPTTSRRAGHKPWARAAGCRLTSEKLQRRREGGRIATRRPAAEPQLPDRPAARPARALVQRGYRNSQEVAGEAGLHLRPGGEGSADALPRQDEGSERVIPASRMLRLNN